MSEPCKYCGESHGIRCPSIAAIEYHPDGTMRRIEFVQPQMWSPPAFPMPVPNPTVWPTANPPWGVQITAGTNREDIISFNGAAR
jgi:hypothetical protein